MSGNTNTKPKLGFV